MHAHFQNVQQDFCQWLRDPPSVLSTAVQGVPVDRMQVYRELLFNNVASFIDMVFPVAKSMLKSTVWESLQQEFFARAQCQSPFYLDISKEFLDYQQQAEPAVLADYPWLIELLHVEWMELHVELAEFEQPDSRVLLHADDVLTLAENTDMQLSVPVWILGYRWPVYDWREGQDLADIQENPGFLLVWRDRQDERCQQLLAPAYALIIDYMLQAGRFSVANLEHGLAAHLTGLGRSEQKKLFEQVLHYLATLQLLRFAG